MTVKRIVPNIATDNVAAAQAFYGDLLGLDLAMDMGWINTFTGNAQAQVQISIASEGGSDTPVPDVSVEVSDVDAVHAKAVELGFEITYPLSNEPWGARRFFVRDPFGKTINILMHQP